MLTFSTFLRVFFRPYISFSTLTLLVKSLVFCLNPSTPSIYVSIFLGYIHIEYWYDNVVQLSHKLLFLLNTDLRDDLRDVVSELVPVSANWKNMGITLRLDPNILDSIAVSGGDCTACLTSMVTEWLKKNYNVKRFGEPTWQWLVEAVGDPTGGANVAQAGVIARKHKARGTSSGYILI